MKLKLSLVVAAAICLLVLADLTDAKRVMKGGKPHRRSKRTIGDIINWKLGLLQNIFDGITGFFGGGGDNNSPSSSYGAPSSSYGAPSSSYGAPQKPSYNAPSKPSYNAPSKPSYSAPSKPSYNRPNSNGNNNKGGSGFKLPRLPLKGLFNAFKGGDKGNNNNNGGGYNAPSRPSYNAPAGNPSYNAPSQGYGAPSVNQGGFNAPTVNQNYAAPTSNQQGYNNGGGFPQGPPRQPNPNDFGPSNAIKMLPAPNLATGRPPAGFGGGSGYNGGANNGGNGFNNGGGFGGQANQALDSYGAPEAAPIDSYGAPQAAPIDEYGAPQADPIDSYGAPQADPIDSYGAPQADPVDEYGAPQAAPIDSYGSPQADPVASPAADDYGAPQAAPIAAAAAPAEDSYGSPQADPVAASQAADDYGAPRGPPVGAGSGFREQKELPAQDAYSGNSVQAPVRNTNTASKIVNNAPVSAPDSYGSPVSPVLAPDNTALPATASNSAAAPVAPQDAYGSPVSPLLTPGGDYEDAIDARDSAANGIALIQSTLQQANPLPASFEEVQPRNPAPSAGTADPDPVDVYGSALAPVGTSAPVPEEIFTQDSSEPTSFDSYGGLAADSASAAAPAAGQADDIDSYGVEEFDNRVQDVNAQNPERTTPAPGPILFTYAPSTEKANLPLADPLNVIPDDYEYSNYVDDEYDPNDIPADQAAPLPGYGGDDLDSYGENSLDSYGGGRDTDVAVSIPSLTTPAQEITGFTDLRSLQFTTAAPIEIAVEEVVESDSVDYEPEITTYSPPIDFKLGTTASEGILAGEVQYDDEQEEQQQQQEEQLIPELAPIPDEVYDNDYEEPDTSYNPDVNIPLQVEEVDQQSAELPNYNEPVVLLLGTPDQELGELDSYTGALSEKVSRKRSPDPAYLKQKYNNWFNRANDWSQKISARIENRNSIHNARTYYFRRH